MKTRCRTLAVWVGLGGALGFLGCSPAPDPWAGAAHPRIIVTIPPLYSFVKGVAGERASVKVLCKETGPHAYSYNAQDLYQFQDADLFFAVGLGLDDKFADTLDAQSQKKRRPDFRYIKLGDGLGKLRLPAERDHDEHDKGKKEAHGHEQGEYDPHVWLGIEQAKAMVAAIRDELKKTDAAHAKDYDGNAARYLDTLDDVLTYGKDKLKGGKNKKLISFHDSLEYFAKSFDLKIVDTVELAPGDDPGSQRMKRLIDEALKGDVRVIAVEPQYTPKAAEALRRDVKAKANGHEMKLVDVDPLETANGKELEEQGAKWYAHKMKENLDKLAQGLK